MKTVAYTDEIPAATVVYPTVQVNSQGNILAAHSETEFVFFKTHIGGGNGVVNVATPAGGFPAGTVAWFQPISGTGMYIDNLTGVVLSPPGGSTNTARVQGTSALPSGDGFICTKRIKNVRFHIHVVSNSPHGPAANCTFQLRLNEVLVLSAPVTFHLETAFPTPAYRTSNVYEWGNIPANTKVDCRLTDMTNNTIGDESTYFIIHLDRV